MTQPNDGPDPAADVTDRQRRILERMSNYVQLEDSVRDALQDLDRSDSVVLTTAYLQDLGPKEAALRLGLSTPGSVGDRLEQAVQRLQKRLEDRGVKLGVDELDTVLKAIGKRFRHRGHETSSPRGEASNRRADAAEHEVLATVERRELEAEKQKRRLQVFVGVLRALMLKQGLRAQVPGRRGGPATRSADGDEQPEAAVEFGPAEPEDRQRAEVANALLAGGASTFVLHDEEEDGQAVLRVRWEGFPNGDVVFELAGDAGARGDARLVLEPTAGRTEWKEILEADAETDTGTAGDTDEETGEEMPPSFEGADGSLRVSISVLDAMIETGGFEIQAWR